MKEGARQLEPKSPIKPRSKGRLCLILFLGVAICLCSLCFFPVAEVHIDDPKHTSTTLKSYYVCGIGIPIQGIDYSGKLVWPGDKRLQFRDILFRVGLFEKRVEYQENGECLGVFNPPGRKGLLEVEFSALKGR